mmetsp:Transcript_21791/g.40074  ORF Transcript_21791/g.40074 Transcript_21791/m.40074 type:complete len:410 (+) Transcript_21791:53-1282(+)
MVAAESEGLTLPHQLKPNAKLDIAGTQSEGMPMAQKKSPVTLLEGLRQGSKAPPLPQTAFEKKQQRELEELLTELAVVDWAKVRAYVGMPALNPNVVDAAGMSTGHRSAYEGHTDVLKWCLRTGLDPNSQTALGRSLLHYACDANRVGCVRLLLEHQADVNATSLSHQTPLHTCCAHGSYEATLELLQGSKHQIVDVDAEDQKRQIPEALAKDKRIKKLIHRYRAAGDERRQKALTEQALKRLFRLFAGKGEADITLEDLALSKTVVKSVASPKLIEEKTPPADPPQPEDETGVSWEYFKKVLEQLVEAWSIEHRELLNKVVTLECDFLKEEAHLDLHDKDAHKLVMMSPRTRKIATANRTRPSTASQLGSPRKPPPVARSPRGNTILTPRGQAEALRKASSFMMSVTF